MKRTVRILILTIVLAITLALSLSAVALAEDWNPGDAPDGTSPNPIWERMIQTGEAYNFDTGEFVPNDQTHEGEAADPYIWPVDGYVIFLPAGTYLMPDGSLYVYDGVGTWW